MPFTTIDHSYSNDARVLGSAKISLGVQVFLGLITAASIVVPIEGDEHKILRSVAILETSAQVVEFVWYALSVFYFRNIQTWARYIDWFLSTPVMLISTMTFLMYCSRRDDGTGEMNLVDIFKDDRLVATSLVLSFNFIMLVFGLLVELGVFEPALGLGLGSMAFLASFGTIFLGYVRSSGPLGFGLYMFTYFVWAAYGVSATLSPVPKNICYNALDVVSKNFFGVFIFVVTLTV